MEIQEALKSYTSDIDSCVRLKEQIAKLGILISLLNEAELLALHRILSCLILYRR